MHVNTRSTIRALEDLGTRPEICRLSSVAMFTMKDASRKETMSSSSFWDEYLNPYIPQQNPESEDITIYHSLRHLSQPCGEFSWNSNREAGKRIESPIFGRHSTG
jgi:hypothetical protein